MSYVQKREFLRCHGIDINSLQSCAYKDELCNLKFETLLDRYDSFTRAVEALPDVV